MAGCINYFLRKRLPAAVIVAAVVAFLFVFTPYALGGQEQLVMPGRPVPLILDPKISTFRIAPKTHPRIMGPMVATITVNFLSSGTGTWGDTCEQWPSNAQTAFSYAVAIWEGYLNAAGPIVIEACWTDMGSPYILGHGGAAWMFYNFTNAPATNTLYPGALINALTGVDGNPGAPEIAVAFNKTFDWYFGTDENVGSQVDFVSVVLHEICHGLGFLGSMDYDDGVAGDGVECNGTSGYGCWGWSGMPYAYDLFAVDGAGQSLINDYTNPSTALGTALTSNNLYFDGTNARAANGNTNVKLYAPSPWESGSSYAHLDESYNDTENALMTYALNAGELDRDPGPVTLGILKDIGWSIAGSCSYSLSSSSNSVGVSGGSGYTVTVTAGSGCGWTAVSNNGWITVTGGASGTGGGTVTYSVQAATAYGDRSGTITIAGQTFTVNQTGCTYTLTPSSNTLTSAGGTDSFSVATNGTACDWTPAESLGWVGINSGHGPGNASVSYTVAANSGAARSGNINVADKTFMISQDAVSSPTADFLASPTSGSVPFQVTFTDLSTNATSWSWDFDDSGTSTLQNPTHTYQTTVGSPFTVTLTVSNASGSDHKSISITADSCGNQPVRYTGISYPSYNSSIGGAYGAAASADELDIQAKVFSANIAFNLDKTVTLKGGYDCDYSATRIPDTVINGTVTVSNGPGGGGTVIFDQIVIK